MMYLIWKVKYTLDRVPSFFFFKQNLYYASRLFTFCSINISTPMADLKMWYKFKILWSILRMMKHFFFIFFLQIEKYLHHPKAPEEKKSHDHQTSNSLRHSLSPSRYSKNSHKDKHNKELHLRLMNKSIRLLVQVAAIIINNSNNLKWPR